MCALTLDKEMYYGFRLFFSAKLLVTIPSYMYFSDGYIKLLARGISEIHTYSILLIRCVAKIDIIATSCASYKF